MYTKLLLSFYVNIVRFAHLCYIFGWDASTQLLILIIESEQYAATVHQFQWECFFANLQMSLK